MQESYNSVFKQTQTSSCSPGRRLRPYIRKYAFRTNTKKNLHNIPLTTIQNGNPEIFIHFTKSKIIQHLPTKNESCSNTLVGLFDWNIHPIIRYIIEEQDIIWVTITLTFSGLIKLLKVTGKDLANNVIHLDEMFGTSASNLQNRLKEADCNYERKLLLDSFFLKLLKEPNKRKTEVLERLDNLMISRDGKLSIDDLAEKLCISYRSVERLFHEDIGISFRDYLHIYRLNKSLTLMSHKKSVDYCDLCYLCGYYDQSHFIKEFRDNTGYTPKQFMKVTGGNFYLDRACVIDKNYQNH